MEINQRVYYNENQLKKIPIPFEGIEGSWVNYEQKKITEIQPTSTINVLSVILHGCLRVNGGARNNYASAVIVV